MPIARPGHDGAVRPAALAACVLASALTWCGAAGAHLIPEPQFVTTGGVSTLSLAGPNERQEPMTGLAVTLPSGLRIVRALSSDAWSATVDGATATWRGGPLPYLAEAAFVLEVDVSAPPGQVAFETVQLYEGGERVTWPVTLTVLPGPDDGPAENLAWALAAGVAGLAVTAGLAALAWRRRTRTLQEK
jgi:hypothetical protein